MNIPFQLPTMDGLAAMVRRAAEIRPFRLLSASSNMALVLGVSLLGVAASMPARPGDLYPLENTLRPAAARPMLMLAADGTPFAARGDCVAELVTVGDLPKHLIDAVLAMEDRRFYSHMGIDPIGIARASKRNYEAGTIREGGSTITQQLVKMSYLSSVKTLDRKAEEALVAMWLEARLTKTQILERYLSSAYFGEGCFGVRAAAKHFFDKQPGDLSLAESALLVALLRSPTQLTNNFGDAYKRADLVLRAMVRDGRLDPARLTGIRPAVLDAKRAEEFGGYYADWLSDQLLKQIEEPHSRQTLLVHTTFEPELQRMAQEAVRSVLDKRGEKLRASQGALVAMRTDGRVVAMVGGRERAASQFNRAVQARRQPGSAFKTFVYLAALRAGAEIDMRVVDKPISINGWEPENFGGGHRGRVSLPQAFASSINSVAVQLSEAVGPDAVVQVARDLGIASPLAPHPSIALGTSEVSLLEMTAAYAAIAAGAYPVQPWGAAGLGARSASGGEPPQGAGRWKLEEAEDMRDLLSDVIRRGTGNKARLPIEAFGKTGTSQDHRDGWFIGFAGNLVVGVWVGNDDDAPMKGVTGGSLPAQIWKSFMLEAMEADPAFDEDPPQVAAFEARSREPQDFASWETALENLAELADLAPREQARYGHFTVRGSYGDDRRADRRRGERRRRTVSRDFQQQLNSMGWPGQ
jgi:penicillin-binding protein 1A